MICTWQQLTAKSKISAVWQDHFKDELTLLLDLARDADATLTAGGLSGRGSDLRMLHVINGGKPTDAELKLPVVPCMQRLGKILRLVACSMWPEMYDLLHTVKACKSPDVSCMAKVYRLSWG